MKINGNKILIFNFIILLCAVFIVPYSVNAKSCRDQCKGNSDYNTCFNKCKKDKKSSSNSNNNSNSNTVSTTDSEECNALLGDKEKEESVAWLVQKLLDYLKILGPILVVILSSVDFATAIISSNDDTMKKAQKKLITRLIAAVLLFLVPTIVEVLLDIFGITGCTIY